MGWEDRKGRRYYYRKRREGNRVISEYVGAGELAEALANLDECEREMARLERERWKREQEAERAICAKIDRAGAYIRELVAATLLANGYHQHKGQWRRKRGRVNSDG